MNIRHMDPEPTVSKLHSSEVSSLAYSGSIFHDSTSCNLSASGSRSSIFALTDTIVEFVPTRSDSFVISFDGCVTYELEKVPKRRHCWYLRTNSGKRVAHLRASRCFSWLEILTSFGAERITQKYRIGNGLIEWKYYQRDVCPDISGICWRRVDQSMVIVHNDVVQLPPVAGLFFSNVSSDGFGMRWRKPVNQDDIFEKVVLCTALISRWKRSRELHLIATISPAIQDPLIRWLHRNLELGPDAVPLCQLILWHPAFQEMRAQM